MTLGEFVEPISSRFGTRNVGDATIASGVHHSREFVEPISSHLGHQQMGAVTIPRIMTEKLRCHIHSKNVKPLSN